MGTRLLASVQKDSRGTGRRGTCGREEETNRQQHGRRKKENEAQSQHKTADVSDERELVRRAVISCLHKHENVRVCLVLGNDSGRHGV